MNADVNGGNDQRLEEVLAAWYLAVDRGERPDLEELCPDAPLRERVRALLADEPGVLKGLHGERSTDGAVATSSDAAVVERLGDFELKREIGRGGMGTVYLAEQRSLGRLVALKVLSGALLDERARLRFRREAELAAALDHANIVPVHATGEEDGRAWIAMKLLTGPGLADLELPLAPREAARIGVAVADALEAAHLTGIVHRDVKPGNVILDHDVPVVVDFGLARSQSDLTLTREGTVPGTLPYLAPELLADPRRLDPRVDVYALGAMLFELLTGAPPFPASDPAQLVRQVATKEPPRLPLGREHKDLETIVLKALEKQPERRTPTALALGRDLQAYLDGRPVSARPIRWPTRLWRRARRHPRITLGSSAAVVAIAVLAGVSLAGRAREERMFEETLALAHSAVDEGDYGQGLRVLAPLRATRSTDPRLVDLARIAETGAAFEDLIDALIVRRAAIREDTLRERLAALDRTPATTLFQGAVELWLAIAAWHLGEEGRARELLATAASGVAAVQHERALAAVRNLITGERRWEALPDVDASADDHVLVALAMFVQGLPVERQREELALALKSEASHQRARFALAIAEASADRYAESRFILLGLVRGDETPQHVWRALARASLESGDPEEALRYLDRIPVERRTAADHHIELDVLVRRGDLDAFDERVAVLSAEAGEPVAEFLLVRAEVLGHLRGDFEQADALFEQARDTAADLGTREIAMASRYRLHVDAALRALPTPFDEREPLLLPLADRGAELLAGLTLDRTRGIVTWKLGRVMLELYRTGPGFSRLAEAIRLGPNEIGPRLDYASYALAFLQDFPGLPQQLREQAPSGLVEHLETSLAHQLPPLVDLASRLDGEDRHAVLRSAFLVAQRLEDWRTIERVAEELAGLVPAQGRPSIDEARETARDKLRVFYDE